MTPAAFSAADRRLMALYAPRNLKAPMRWKFSHLKNTRMPGVGTRAGAESGPGVPPWVGARTPAASHSSSVREVRTGVWWTTPARRLAAARTASGVI